MRMRDPGLEIKDTHFMGRAIEEVAGAPGYLVAVEPYWLGALSVARPLRALRASIARTHRRRSTRQPGRQILPGLLVIGAVPAAVG